jgi:hypothetical protein
MAKAYENSPASRPRVAVPRTYCACIVTAYPVSVVQATTSDGFNWSDAGIGASVAFGAALMLLLAVVIGRRFRSRPTGLAST